mgnify:CR=1 FL=1
MASRLKWRSGLNNSNLVGAMIPRSIAAILSSTAISGIVASKVPSTLKDWTRKARTSKVRSQPAQVRIKSSKFTRYEASSALSACSTYGAKKAREIGPLDNLHKTTASRMATLAVVAAIAWKSVLAAGRINWNLHAMRRVQFRRGSNMTPNSL